MADTLVIATRGSTGLYLGNATNPAKFPPDDNRPAKEIPCRVLDYSHDGRYFLFCDTTRTMLVDLESNKPVVSLPLKRTMVVAFSPKDTYFMLWEPYATYAGDAEDKKPDPNLRIYRTTDGSQVANFVAQKQATWKPVFSDDEKIMVRQVGGELLVHNSDNLEHFVFKKAFPKFETFALSPGSGQFIAIFTPPQGAQAASVQIRRVEAKFPVVNTKNFFNGDKANLIWNNKGTAILIHAQVEVDTTNKSYYGQSYVYLANITGDSCQVTLPKNGPVYAVKWNPNSVEFAVCYGYMPSKVTIFNFRGEPFFDMVEGPRNEIYYNVFGNILLVCGFGNLAVGRMEFWDTEKRKLIISIDVPNTTFFQWAPDGRHFITATTTPRLRIDNNYRLWHYSGKLLFEKHYQSPVEELWQVEFRPMLKSKLNEFKVQELTSDQKMQAGLMLKKNGDESQGLIAAGALKKAAAYIPPHLRNLSDPKPGASKNENRGPTTVLSESEKKIRSLQKKIDDIAKLKVKKERGEKLESNQLEKIEKEGELVAALESLKLST
ncbi:unnamed protein product, partial [Mesorhabditis belari]|uniref:Eukaryotic translation initiation factor 2A n=1 Tax=Mesorhabditis belari TaxID=2138241 RepID=A0AAF3ENB7_9BILA